MMSINLSDIAILNIKGFDYRSIISLIIKTETTHSAKLRPHVSIFSFM